MRGVASATITVSAERRVVVALVDSRSQLLDATVANPAALVSQLASGAPPPFGVLPLFEAGPPIPAHPASFTIPREDERPFSRYDVLLILPVEPVTDPYSLSIVGEQVLTEASAGVAPTIAASHRNRDQVRGQG